MRFEWCNEKNRKNIEKHAVRFEDAQKIFDGFTVDVLDNRFDDGEDRTISIGMAAGVVVLAVVHTDRQGSCRIISARQANTKERKRYDEAIRQSLES